MVQPQSLTYTVTMDANLARHVGRCAAMLYNLLLWQSQSEVVQNYDRDGWFYLTAKRFEELTSYSANKFTQASDKLVERGLIEKKKTFRHDAIGVSCTHFRIICADWKSILESPVSQKMGEATHRNCETNIKEENKEEREGFTLSACETTPPAFPVGAHQSEKVSVRPNKKEADPARRPFAVGQAVLKAWGFRTAKIGVPMAKLIKGWLDAGFGEKDIIEAGEMMKKSGDEYWAKATPIQMLTENAMLWYQQHKKKADLSSIPHIKIGDRYYEIDPQTGHPIREIKL